MRWFFPKGIEYGERMTRMQTIEGRQVPRLLASVAHIKDARG
jgi:hypothetical protein